MSRVKLDVVLTSAPSETEEENLSAQLAQEYAYGDAWDTKGQWNSEPLWILDHEARNW